MTKWNVYSYLKRNNGQVNEDFTDMFMYTNPNLIQEGIQEYEEMQRNNSAYYEPINWGITYEPTNYS